MRTGPMRPFNLRLMEETIQEFDRLAIAINEQDRPWPRKSGGGLMREAIEAAQVELSKAYPPPKTTPAKKAAAGGAAGGRKAGR